MEIFDMVITILEDVMVFLFLFRCMNQEERQISPFVKKLLMLIILIIATSILNYLAVEQTVTLLVSFIIVFLQSTMLFYEFSIRILMYNIVWTAAIVLGDAITCVVTVAIIQIPLSQIFGSNHLYILFAVFSLVVKFIILMYISWLIGRRKNHWEYENQEMILFALKGIGCMVELIFLFELSYHVNDIDIFLQNMILAVAVIAIIVFITIFCTFKWHIEKKNRLYRQSIIDYASKSTEQYYTDMEKENRKVRELYHDMKNHLMILQEMGHQNQEMADGYLEDLSRKVDELASYYHTGNVVLDILLKKKQEEAGEHFRLDIVIQQEAIKNFENIELCSIFSNAIDNALEHQKEVWKKESGWLRIRASVIPGNHAMLLFENPYYGKVNGSGILSTWKGDSYAHGIGLKSLRNIAKRHNGYLKVDVKDNKFIMSIMIPV